MAHHVAHALPAPVWDLELVTVRPEPRIDGSRAFGRRPLKWQESERGEAVREWLDDLDSLPDRVEELSLDNFPEELDFEEIAGDEDPMEIFNEIEPEPSK